MIWDSPVLADGAAALAFYLIATDTVAAPAAVTRVQVEALLAVPPGGTVLQVFVCCRPITACPPVPRAGW
ncbi:hypothetical protein [Kitasatospora sp. NPDC091207]|uniref:hypothetical protein n=1 Tax=Kitasatospora sp. NPDC091207 TaxID=3364083 RepID=UPI0038157711